MSLLPAKIYPEGGSVLNRKPTTFTKHEGVVLSVTRKAYVFKLNTGKILFFRKKQVKCYNEALIFKGNSFSMFVMDDDSRTKHWWFRNTEAWKDTKMYPGTQIVSNYTQPKSYPKTYVSKPDVDGAVMIEGYFELGD